MFLQRDTLYSEDKKPALLHQSSDHLINERLLYSNSISGEQSGETRDPGGDDKPDCGHMTQ